jgi:chorismate synthase
VDGRLRTRTNFSGGIQGGISNGEHVYFKVGFKPPATIGQAQATSTYDGKSGTLEVNDIELSSIYFLKLTLFYIIKAKGRHDPCVLPRAVPIVEAMAALVVMDAVLIQSSRKSSSELLSSKLNTLNINVPPVLKGELFADNK